MQTLPVREEAEVVGVVPSSILASTTAPSTANHPSRRRRLQDTPSLILPAVSDETRYSRTMSSMDETSSSDEVSSSSPQSPQNTNLRDLITRDSRNANFRRQESALSKGSRGDASEASIPDGGAFAREVYRQPPDSSSGGSTHYHTKICVFLGIVIAGIAGSVSAALLIEREELNDFELQYRTYASGIVDAAEVRVEQTVGAIRTLTRSLTSTAIENDLSFPSVSLPHFEVLGGDALATTNARMIISCSLVSLVDRPRWESYAVENQQWIREGLDYEGLDFVDPGLIPENIYSWPSLNISSPDDRPDEFLPIQRAFSLPVWQSAPVPRDAGLVNLDLFTGGSFAQVSLNVVQSRGAILSPVCGDECSYLTNYIGSAREESNPHPMSYFLLPVFSDFVENVQSSVVGAVAAVVSWDQLLSGVVASSEDVVVVIDVVVDDQCGGTFTYRVQGEESILLGIGDLHDRSYDGYMRLVDFATSTRPPSSDESDENQCVYTLTLYPTERLREQFSADGQVVIPTVVAIVFLLLFLLLLAHDRVVNRRQRKLMVTAERTNKILSSLFPKNVQKRVLEEVEQPMIRQNSNRTELQRFLGDSTHPNRSGRISEWEARAKPIADFFPNTTIIFADIVGFTAWSSTREPSQVFSLLETIYHAFDELAKKRRVFKVETVGDCYVAVAGLPDARKDHPIAMARFAQACMKKFTELVKEMEVVLGPDTGELGLRIGLHSGPVTAGVLRGERSRFQLFGDTVNTTARMESTGERNKIQMSSETASMLVTAGKSHWVSPRTNAIVAKGKGEMQTYWLEMRSHSALSHSSSVDFDRSARESDFSTHSETQATEESVMDSQMEPSSVHYSDKTQRLIQWNTELLSGLLKLIIAKRIDAGVRPAEPGVMRSLEHESLRGVRHGRMVLDEVVEVIDLPGYEGLPQDRKTNPMSIVLSDEVLTQMKDFVTTIAVMYRDNPFHNFEHASHVTMSVHKLLYRIVAPDLHEEDGVEESLHEHTYGITSDPLIQFSVVLSALIHDIDHPGVPNSTLVVERAPMAMAYHNKSVAEQNSVDLAWDLLLDPQFEQLRRALYTTPAEFKRFRQLVVNSVMATDIMDKELGAFRKARWAKAFTDDPCTEGTEKLILNRKATIVLEHLIQASDVAHTMQHWHVYCKWNERLFMEVYEAYLCGRHSHDPSIDWYEGELNFFDFYVLPLAKKLESCGVFGVSSDEYLNYAVQNRRKWELHGKEMVMRYLQKRDGQSIDSPKPTQLERLSSIDLTNSMTNSMGTSLGTSMGTSMATSLELSQSSLDRNSMDRHNLYFS